MFGLASLICLLESDTCSHCSCCHYFLSFESVFLLHMWLPGAPSLVLYTNLSLDSPNSFTSFSGDDTHRVIDSANPAPRSSVRGPSISREAGCERPLHSVYIFTHITAAKDYSSKGRHFLVQYKSAEAKGEGQNHFYMLPWGTRVGDSLCIGFVMMYTTGCGHFL